LLHAALRGAFGEDVQQAGSLVAPDRLRFDFTLARAPTEKELRQVEDTVRRQIQADLPVCAEEMEFEAAMARGALAFFGDKYGDRVRVVQIGGDDVSLELCGGTHVAATSEIGDVRLESSEAVSRGTRRLEMIAGQALQQRLREHYDVLQEVASELKVPPREVPAAVRELKEAKKHLAKARKSLSLYRAEDLLQAAEGRLLRAKLPSDIDLKDALDHLGKKLGPESVVFLVQVEGGKLRYGARVGKSAPFHASADDLVRDFAAATGGSGGGKGQFAQGGGGEPGLLEAGWRALAKRLETP
jgi:alanyl-tRNA synthetase